MKVTQLFSTGHFIYGIAVQNRIVFVIDSTGLWKCDGEKPRILLKYSMFRGISCQRRTLYLTDWINHQIRQYNIDWEREFSPLLGTYHFPYGVYMDNNHPPTLYVTDQHRVLQITAQNFTILTESTSNNHHDNNTNNSRDTSILRLPKGVAAIDGIIYVCDQANHCIRVIQNGLLSTLAGIPSKPGHQDGPLHSSLFHDPLSIIVEQDGNLLITDNNGLRRINLKNQTVVTVTNKVPLVCLVQADYRTFYGGCAAGTIWKIEYPLWKWRRYLWIAKLKENSSYCHLSILPVDIIRVISSLLDSQ